MNTLTRRLDPDADAAPLRLRERADEYVLLVHFPSFEPEYIEIEARGDTLYVRGRRAPTVADALSGEGSGVHDLGFTRAVQLPPAVDLSAIRAAVVADVLEVHLPKLGGPSSGFMTSAEDRGEDDTRGADTDEDASDRSLAPGGSRDRDAMR